MPHCRVRGVDATAALAMDGVVAILRADEVPEQAGPANNILTDEPHFVGEPILAVAAVMTPPPECNIRRSLAYPPLASSSLIRET